MEWSIIWAFQKMLEKKMITINERSDIIERGWRPFTDEWGHKDGKAKQSITPENSSSLHLEWQKLYFFICTAEGTDDIEFSQLSSSKSYW